MFKLKSPMVRTVFVLLVLFSTTCSASNAQTAVAPPAAPPNSSDAKSTADSLANATAEKSTQDAFETAVITPTAYLPFINRPVNKFFGIYFNQYWTPVSVAETMPGADAGAGKKHTAVGWFIDLEDTAFNDPVPPQMANNLYGQLESLWQAGYISFINMGTNANAAQISNGERDTQITYAARVYKEWVGLGGGRRAMIAPLQEMNGDWTVYGRDSTPEEFKQAYVHILNIFAVQGVTRDMLWWVFAPNGYHDPAYPERAFENYYPGDNMVDINGFSAYNYGFCPAIRAEWRRWESYSEIFEPHVARMLAMAPSKPVIIAEFATTAYYTADGNGTPVADLNVKSQWLTENYDYFAQREGLIGMFYFSFSEFDGYSCDLEINPDGVVLSGYRDGLSPWIYKYFNAADLDYLLIRQFK
jgi:hypothetical protein